MDLNREQLRAAAELSPEELAFANHWLRRDETGWAQWRCVAEAYPGHDPTNVKSCAATAARLINHCDRVRRYINAVNSEALRLATVDRANIIRMLQRQAVSVEDRLNPYVEWHFVKDDKGRAARRAWVPDTDTITDNKLGEFVDSLTECPDGGWYVNYHEICDEKTRVRAVELLGKIGGEFVDQVKLSGGTTDASFNIDASDPTKASQDYMQLMGQLNAAR